MKQLILSLSLLVALPSCNGQIKAPSPAVVLMAQTGKAATSADNIRAITQDSRGTLWFGADGGGLYQYNGKSLVLFTEKEGLCNNQVRSIHEDKEGIIWLVTGNGICRCSNGIFQSADKKATTEPAGHASNWQKTEGDLWLPAGTFRGVYRYSNGNLYNYHFPRADSQGHNATNAYDEFDVYCIFKDRQDNIWFGTQSRGVCHYDGTHFTWITGKGLDSAAVRTIYQDKAGDMWFGNNGYGLFRYDGKQLTNITDEKGLGNPDFIKKLDGREGTLARVWTIAEDTAGNLWVGTIDAGAWRYNGKTLTNYARKQGLTDIGVTAIYKDARGTLWAGTAGNICWFNGQTFAPVVFK